MKRFSTDDPKLTAYAFGELQGEERAAVETALRDDPEARAAVEAIRTFGADLGAALASEPEEAIGEETSAARSEEGRSRPPELTADEKSEYGGRRPKVLRFPQLYFVIGGLAAACVAVMVLMHDQPKPPAVQYTEINLNPSPTEQPKTDDSAASEAVAHDDGPTRSASTSLAIPPQFDTETPRPAPHVTRLSVSNAAVAKAAGGAEPTRPERDNPFVAAEQAPRSTFSAEVDTASYAKVRRIVEAGRLPPADDVRIEELLNYFPYQYAAPATAESGGAPIAASIESAEAPWAPSHRLVRVGLRARDIAATERPAANLVFLVDVSGSMDAPNKLPLVKDSLRMLLGRLRAEDRVAIVTYAGRSGVALPSTPVAQLDEILAALNRLSPGGSTNGASGIQLAYDIAKANQVTGGINRVILCTDGDFNVGLTNDEALGKLVEAKAKLGVSLTVLGFGMGRDNTLELLADKGAGSYGYIDSRRDANKLLVQQVNSTLVDVAQDVKVHVDFNPGRVAGYRLIGYEDGYGVSPLSADDAVDASDIGAGDEVTALYEIVPTGAADGAGGTLLTLHVEYRDAAGAPGKQMDVAFVDDGEQFANASADFKFAAAVAQYGMILRDSPHRGQANLRDVIAWAAAGAKTDRRGYRRDFIDLARKTEALLQ